MFSCKVCLNLQPCCFTLEKNICEENLPHKADVKLSFYCYILLYSFLIFESQTITNKYRFGKKLSVSLFVVCSFFVYVYTKLLPFVILHMLLFFFRSLNGISRADWLAVYAEMFKITVRKILSTIFVLENILNLSIVVRTLSILCGDLFKCFLKYFSPGQTKSFYKSFKVKFLETPCYGALCTAFDVKIRNN